MTPTPFATKFLKPLWLVCVVVALAASAPSWSAVADPATAARAFLVDLYRHYPTADTPGAFDPVGADGPKVFTPALVGLIRQDQKYADGEVGALDGDPLCDCQDNGGLQAKVGAVTPAGPAGMRAVVTLTFTASSPRDVRRLVILLSRIKGGWRIADIASPSQTSLRGYLARSNREHAAGR